VKKFNVDIVLRIGADLVTERIEGDRSPIRPLPPLRSLVFV